MSIRSLLAACLLLAPASAQEPKQAVREFISVAGTVDRIDRGARTLTLQVDPTFKHTVYVPPDFKLFDDLKVGDKVVARVRESVVVSARPGLKPHNITDTTTDAARKQQGTPDTQVLQQLKIVVTIEAIDRTTQLVTYKSADGRRTVRAVAEAKLLEGLKPGDVIEVTLTRERVVELHRQ